MKAAKRGVDAIELLMEEHRFIERALDALDNFAAELRTGRVNEGKSYLADVVRFLREFADAHHHKKEEDILFEAMVAEGFPLKTGPIAVMLHEHEQGRALVQQLDEASRSVQDWDEVKRDEIANIASAFVALLESHIHKEDEILYVMARQRLSDEAMAAINEQVADFQATAQQSGTLDELMVLLADLTSV